MSQTRKEKCQRGKRVSNLIEIDHARDHRDLRILDALSLGHTPIAVAATFNVSVEHVLDLLSKASV